MKTVTVSDVRYECSYCKTQFRFEENCQKHETLCEQNPDYYKQISVWRVIFSFDPFRFEASRNINDAFNLFDFCAPLAVKCVKTQYGYNVVWTGEDYHKFDIPSFREFGKIFTSDALYNCLIQNNDRELYEICLAVAFVRNSEEYRACLDNFLDFCHSHALDLISVLNESLNVKYLPCKELSDE